MSTKNKSKKPEQVQLRLHQVVGAPVDLRDELLKDLEHFAFRGVPDIGSSTASRLPELSSGETSNVLDTQEKSPVNRSILL
jgi:hypothetical protein